jgi:hypothetical protein
VASITRIVSCARRFAIEPTWRLWVMWSTARTTANSDSTAKNTATATETSGTSSSFATSDERVERNAKRLKTVAPSASPIVCLRTESLSQSRNVRGENWELASWTATSIIDNTSVIAVIKPPAMAPNTARALSALVATNSGTVPMLRSIHSVSWANTTEIRT